jgi:succinoglycan biosynthesis transport protein ExoP
MISQDRSLRAEVPPAAVPTVLPVERVFSYGHALRLYWKVVAVTTLLSTLTALLLSLASAKQYDADAKVLVADAEPINIVTQSVSRSQDPERELNTGIQLVKLNIPARRALRRTGHPMSLAALLARTDVGPEGNSNLVRIRVRDSSPGRAAALANAFAVEYVNFRRDAAREPYRRAAELAQNRLGVLGSDADSAGERSALKRRINDLQVALALQTGGVQLINRAAPPTGPSLPRTRLNVLAGLMAGLFLGCVLAFLLDRWHANLLLDRWHADLVTQFRAARRSFDSKR